VRWLAALTCISFVAPAFSQDTVTLTWKFKEGQTFYQEMTTTTRQTMKVMGSDINQTQTQTFYFSWTPDKKEGDNWVLKQKIEGVKMRIEIGGQPIEYDSTKEGQTSSSLGDFFKALVGAQFTLTVNKDFKVTKIEGRDEFLKKLSQANPQMETLLKQILNEEALKEMADPTFAAVRSNPVKKGETRNKSSKLDMGPIGTYENSYKYVYEGKDKDKSKLDRIKVETTLIYHKPTDPASGGLPFKITAANLTSKNAGGTILFDNDKGRVEEANMSVELSGDLSIEIGGQTTTVKLEQKQTTLVKTTDTNPTAKKPS
jgi:hypothetical protein